MPGQLVDGHVGHQAGEVDDAAYVAVGDGVAQHHVGTDAVAVLEASGR